MKFSELAFSPNDHTVHIYKLAGNKWQPDCVLTEVRKNTKKLPNKAEKYHSGFANIRFS